jgi:hypothetical protein
MRRVKDLAEADIFPGDYYGDGYYYHVSTRLTGGASRNVAGYAKDNKNIAILPSKTIKCIKAVEETETVFIDSTESKFYQLRYITTEDDVRVFAYGEIEPTQAITHIKFSTHPTWSNSFSNEVVVKYNWTENDEPFSKGRPETAQKLIDGIKYGTGFYSKITLNSDVEITPMSSSISVDFNAKFVMGSAIDINFNENNPIQPEDKILAEYSQSFYKCEISMLGYSFGIDPHVSIELLLKNIALELKLNWYMYRGFYFEFSKKAKISSTDGYSDTEPLFEYKCLSDGNSLKDLFNIEVKKFTITPAIDLSFILTIKYGKKSTDFKITLSTKVPIDIQRDVVQCPQPGLYGTITLESDIEISFSGMSILSFKIKEWEAPSYNLYKSKPFNLCLFDSKNIAEANEEDMANASQLSYLIGPQYIEGVEFKNYLMKDQKYQNISYYPNDNHGLPYGKLDFGDLENKNIYSIKLEAIKKGSDVSRYSTKLEMSEIIESENQVIKKKITDQNGNNELDVEMIKDESITIGIGKELIIPKDRNIKYVRVTDESSREELLSDKSLNYKLLVRKEGEEYNTVSNNGGVLFSNEGILAGNREETENTYDYLNNRKMAVFIPISSEVQSGESKDIDIVFTVTKYAKENPDEKITYKMGRMRIPGHSGTKSSSELGIENLEIKLVLPIDTSGYYKYENGYKCIVLDEDEKEISSKLTEENDKLIITFNSGVQQKVVFSKTYDIPDIYVRVPNDIYSLIVVKEYLNTEKYTHETHHKYISTSFYLQRGIDAYNEKNLWIPFTCYNYMPIVESIRIEDDLYMIKFNKNNYISANGFYNVPLRRTGSDSKVIFKSYKVFTSYSDGTFWYNFDKIIELGNPGMSCGCIYKEVINNNFAFAAEGVTEDSYSYQSDNDLWPRYLNLSTNGSNLENYKYTLVYQDTAAGKLGKGRHITLYHNEFVFGNNEISKYIDLRNFALDEFNIKLFVYPYPKKNNNGGIMVTTENKDGTVNTVIINYDSNCYKTFDCKSKLLITFIPICTDKNMSYCIFQFNDQKNGTQSLLSYESIDGLNSYTNLMKFGKGNNNEIVTLHTSDWVWKRWNNSVEFSDLPTEINVNFTLYPKRTMLSFETDEIGRISYSSLNINNNITRVFDILGQDDNATGEDFNLLDRVLFLNGTFSIFSPFDKNLRKEVQNLNKEKTKLTFIDNNLIKWFIGMNEDSDLKVTTSFQELDYDPYFGEEKQTKLSVGVIIGIVVGAVAAAAVVVFIIIHFYCKKKDKNNNTDGEAEKGEVAL